MAWSPNELKKKSLSLTLQDRITLVKTDNLNNNHQNFC